MASRAGCRPSSSSPACRATRPRRERRPSGCRGSPPASTRTATEKHDPEQTESSGAGLCRRLPGGLARPALVARMGLDPLRGAGVADVADAFTDLRHAVHQALEVVGLKDEELRVARRPDGGVADVAAQDRDLAEEVAVAQIDVVGVHELDLDLAADDEIHRVRLLAAARHDVALMGGARMQQLHDLGDRRRFKAAEDRHLRDHAPGDDELAPVDDVGEGRRDDADRQRQHGDAHDRGEAADDLAERRDRHDVAVADRRQRHDRPPHGVRDRAEAVGLGVALGQIHEARHRQHEAAEDEQRREKRVALAVDRLQERGQAGGIARKLEEAHQPEERQHPEIGDIEKGDVERDHRKEVDDRRGGAGPRPPRRPGRAPGERHVLDRRPQAQGILGRESGDRQDLEGPKRGAEAILDRGNRLDHNRDHVQQHERDQAVVDDLVPERLDRGVEELVNPPAQTAPRAARFGSGRRHAAASAASTACSAASAWAPSGPPAWAMSRRPPPPLPPSFSAPARTRLTASIVGVRSSVTPTTMPALPSPATPTIATTPEPRRFLPSSARLLRSRISTPETARAMSFTPPMSRIGSAPAVPPIASLRLASASSRSSRRLSSIRADRRSGASSTGVLRRPAISCSLRLSAARWRRATSPVIASSRRTPAATAPSETTAMTPMSPVRPAWVPPQSSTEKVRLAPSPPGALPIETTRTSSPYFSPKSARAPDSIASSTPISFVTTGSFWRSTALAMSATRRTSSSPTGFGWLKSKRRRSGATSEPFWATWSPRTWRKASCRRWVAEWLARMLARRAWSTASSREWPTLRVPCSTTTWCTKRSPSFFWVSATRTRTSTAVMVPVSPTWPPDSP